MSGILVLDRANRTAKVAAAGLMAIAFVWPCMTLAGEVAKPETLGPTYVIKEPNALKEIKAKLLADEKSGLLAKKMEEGKQRAIDYVKNPPPVEAITKADEHRVYYWDPSIQVNQDIKTPDGHYIARAGDKVNPLDKMAWSRMWIFIDGRDPQQVNAAKKLVASVNGIAKVILIGGSHIDISNKLGYVVYFDQAGVYSKKFGISHVPATIRQEGKRLRIDELKL